LDQATAYNTLADGGYAGTRHAIVQLATHSGEVIYDHSRDAPPPHRVLRPETVSSMNSILVQVPESGTARRAALEGIRSAGKTGTTQAYRDAWYVGFTGNYTAAVWLGNDDYTSTRNMTGGSVPAMVWQRLMTYAHQNIELKPIPGIEKPFLDAKPGDAIARAADAEDGDGRDAERPTVLSARTTRLLLDLSRAFHDAPAIQLPAMPETLSSL